MSARAGGRRSRGWRQDRIWQAGFLVGSVAGAAATVAARRLERSARRGLVDWAKVEAIASARLRSAPGALGADELAAADAAYAAAIRAVEPRLAEYLGTPLPGVVERAGVVDRAGWVTANVGAFAALVERLEGGLLDEVVPQGSGFLRAAMAVANRELATRQIAYLLSFMGARVLGQYDLALLSAEATPGRLLFVEENVRATAAALDVPLGPFRTWLVLHEATHAFEFEAHPWLRPYLAERLEGQLRAASADAAGLGREALRSLGRWARGESGAGGVGSGEGAGEGSGEHWLERLMTPEQRRLFRETQAVMSLLEGFSDHVMDELGRELVPGVERIRARFDERRDRRTGPERAILRLSGMDLKLEQYARGARFVAAVAERGGRGALGRLWAGPETLPSEAEIADPERWLRRVVGVAA